jgi:hypothetical protein
LSTDNAGEQGIVCNLLRGIHQAVTSQCI